MSKSNDRARVVITDFIAAGDTEPEQRILAGVAQVEAFDAHDESELTGRIERADAIMLYHHLGLSRRTIERLERCRLIVRCGVGYDNVDWRFAAERGIPVANVPDYGTEEVADSAIGMMLTLTRGIHYLNSRLRSSEGEWKYTQAQPLQRLRGQTFGIIGLGRIGSAATLRAKALGMKVLFYDPYVWDGADKMLGIQRVERLEDLLAQSMVVSLHCPLTEETRHLMAHNTIAQMPMGSYLVNTSRGGVVDVRAMPEAIASGRLAGAGIDVLETEPPRDNDAFITAWRDSANPCYHRVIVNPHSAFYCEEGLMEMRLKGSEACRRSILGLAVRNVINRKRDGNYTCGGKD